MQKTRLRNRKNWEGGCIIPVLIMIALDLIAFIIGGIDALIWSYKIALVWLLVGLVAPFAILKERTTYERQTRKVISRESWNEGVENVRGLIQPGMELTKTHGLRGFIVALVAYVAGYFLFGLAVLACVGIYKLYTLFAH